jgi:hypothetical protein
MEAKMQVPETIFMPDVGCFVNNVSAARTRPDDIPYHREKKPCVWEWISVKDMLPPPYTAVLTCNINGVSQDERDPIIGAWQNENGLIWFEPWRDNEITPTHWMPLPDPPSGAPISVEEAT